MAARAFRNTAIKVIAENNPAYINLDGAMASLEKHVDENLEIKIRYVTMPVANA